MLTGEWSQIRKIVLKRDSHRCQMDGCESTEDLHVHHIIERQHGGSDDPSNLITLCAACHAGKHLFYQAKLGRRIIEKWALRLAKWLDNNKHITSLPENLGIALRLFGLERFRGKQLEVISSILSGESVLFVSPTGSGKSLCYQLPAVVTKGTSYVISPLKALMVDQVSALHSKKIPATYINSDISPQEKNLRYQMLSNDAWKLLYCTPERFDPQMIGNKRELASLADARPKFLVVDEAHCIDKWGRDFRPSYSKLGDARKLLKSPQVIAFTATASVKTQRRILKSLGVPKANVIVSNIDRPNIFLLRLYIHSTAKNFKVARSERHRAKVEHLKAIISKYPEERVMIFVPTRKIGEDLSKELNIHFYHSKLDKRSRGKLLDDYIDGSVKHILCTNAFGMGLDIPDVRILVHWQHPSSVEDFFQEIGRAGRDNKQSVAIAFVTNEDTGLMEFMAKKSIESLQEPSVDKGSLLRHKMASIQDVNSLLINQKACFRRRLLEYFGFSGEGQKLSLGMRIIDFFFSQRVRSKKAHYCCDVCNRVNEDNYLNVISRLIE